MAPLRALLSLTIAAATALTARAQSTTTYSTSTSWALLDNTSLFPKQRTSATAAAASPLTTNPTTTSSSPPYAITPPIPCPGLYYTYGGVCCTSNTLLDCSYPDIFDGYQNASSCCPAGEFGWSLPLSDAQIAEAQADGEYSGCPGNSRNGVCCSGGVIYRDDSDNAEVCSLGTVVWVLTTDAAGALVTSTVPPEPTTTSSEPAWYSRLTASRASAATATATTARGGAGAACGAVDGRMWGAAVLALGGML